MSKRVDVPLSFAVDRGALEARREREREAVEDNATLAKEKGLLEMKKAVLETFEPHERRAKRPARQISFTITEEEHENLAVNARTAGVTMRALILRAIKPFTESPGE